MSMNRKWFVLCAILVVAAFCLNCAAGNYRWDQNINPGHKAGFWAGLWHGLIIIITFIFSLFDKKVGIYEVNNAGWPYNLGFIIGLCFSILAPWRMTKKQHHHHKEEKVCA